ncbi:hypothetical protein SK069_18070 [Patulibacter brassicae]|uniref:Prepilin-type N-terminal cleavage/methylation domain-containing protein n=1 Tax=Patulibacter brassicae TaxID=1705717 RepID=A0ABU4VRC4_9ACTN|nr:hypothetical protein [Patulibacter brassicae]MDX8153511.1 hypothetical protein [Patulibacter brassicae]
MSGSPPVAPSVARRLRSEDGGFTLVEVLVAATILIAGIFATLALMDRGAAATGASLQRDRGAAIAREVVERATGMKYLRTTTTAADGTTTATDTNELVGLSSASSTTRPEVEVATRLRAALDPDGDAGSGPITTSDVGDAYVRRSSWALTRGNTRYTVTYRACTTSDRISNTVIRGTLDCARKVSETGTTVPGGSQFDGSTPGGKCGLTLSSGMNMAAQAALPLNDISVNLQLLSVLGLDLCVDGLLKGLNLLTGLTGPLVSSLCGALGPVGPTVGGVLSGVTGLLGTLGANAQIGLCPAAELRDETLDVAAGIATTTKVETTVRWTEAGTGQTRTIRQTAAVRRATRTVGP